jgi:hypothetical protein
MYAIYFVFSSDLLSIPILPAPESKPHELPFAHETTANGRSHIASQGSSLRASSNIRDKTRANISMGFAPNVSVIPY